MSRLATSFILGYHGCDEAVAEDILSGRADIALSNKDYDWLGPGAYFWEADPRRALEWAQTKVSRGSYQKAAVLGAIIDLRNCLDLVSREDLEILKDAHRSFMKFQVKAGLEVPKNKSAPKQPNRDRVLRFLDCAVIRHLHSMMDRQAGANVTITPYDTVRGMFTEGAKLYPGGGFQAQTHVQIAVRKPECIRGFFRPRPYPSL